MKDMIRNIVKIMCILVFIVLLLFIGNVMVIANNIQNATNEYVAYAFYAVLLVLLLAFIIIPLVKLLKMPSMMEFPKVDDSYTAEKVQKIALNLAANYPNNEKVEQKKFTDTVESAGLTDKDNLIKSVNNEIKRRFDNIESIIKRYGKHVFIVTAISQNNRLDTISVLILNFRMIKDLIKSTGFRPSNIQMLQIYWRVIVTGAFAYATSEAVDFADETFLSEMSTEIGEKVGSSILGKLLGVFTKSLADGAVNGLFTLRLGYVTKHYLEEGFDTFKDKTARVKIYKQSLRDAWKIRNVINETEIRKAS